MTRLQRIVCTALAASALGGLVAVVSADTGPELMPSAASTVRLPPPAEQSGQTFAGRGPRELSAPTAVALSDRARGQQRSEQLERIAQQADGHTRHGCELAGRGAFFAARSELFAALRLVADGLDAQEQTDAHVLALGRALTAMKEAEDFLPGDLRPLAAAELKRIIAAHDTPALKDNAENVAAVSALKSYFTYAQGQFAVAAGEEVAASMALRALGKLYEALAEKKHPTESAAATKAMVFYQAALLTQPDNFMAANDLGVLLARAGDFQAARKMLEYSLTCGGPATCWRNLAIVHRRLGQPAPADWCDQQALACEQYETNRRGAGANAAGSVRWIDPNTFAKTTLGGPAYPGAVARPEMAEQFPRHAAPGEPYGRTPASTPSAAQRLTWGTPTR